MKNKSHYIVILAGGKGERLWPLSRNKTPKQLLPIGNQYSLLEQTIHRITSLAAKKNIIVMTTEQQADCIEKMVGNQVGTILTEPVACNTGPAILLTCFTIFEKDSNATIGFLPADHFILQDIVFRKELRAALNFAQNNDSIALLGLRPNWPATGYGYIEYEQTNKNAEKVTRFHEKPSSKTAKLYITLPNMLWNIGVFCGKASFFIDEYKKVAPKLFQIVMKYYKKEGDYQECENISFDHAVLEKSKRVFVIPADFSWSDVGNLDVFLSLRTKHADTNSSIITINSKNNIVNVPKKLVALIGIEDLCIVETDDVLLISKRKQTDNVKLILNKLKSQNKNHYL